MKKEHFDRISYYFRITKYILLLQGNAVTAKEFILYIILWPMIFWFKKNVVYKTPPWRSFGSPLSSDSTALGSNAFKVSNIYNFTIMGVYCVNAYLLFAAFRYMFLKQSGGSRRGIIINE